MDRPSAAVGGGELPDVEHQHLAAVVAHERGLALGLVLQQHQVHLRGLTASDQRLVNESSKTTMNNAE